ncbi:MAG: MFS transporter [Bacillota bacterium]
MLQAYGDPIIWPALALQRHYGYDYTVIMTFGALFSGSLTPLAAKLCASSSRKTMFLVPAAVFTVCITAQSLSLPLPALLALRAVIGCSLAFLFTAGFTLIGDLLPPAKRGFWIGFNGVVLGAAAFISTPLAGLLADAQRITAYFPLSVPFCAAGIFFLKKYLPPFRGTEKAASLDFRGTAALCGGLGCFFLTTPFFRREADDFSPAILLLLSLMALSFIYFVFHERKIGGSGILPIHVVHSRNFKPILLAAFFSAGSAAFFYYSFAYYMISYMKISAFVTGIAITLQSVFLVILGPSFTSLLTQKGKIHLFAIPFFIGMILLCGAFALFVTPKTSLTVILISMLLFGLYAMLIQNAYPLAAQNYVEESARPYCVGGVHLTQTIGNSVSLTIITILLHTAASRPEQGYDRAYLFCIFLTVLSFISTLLIREKGVSHDKRG